MAVVLKVLGPLEIRYDGNLLPIRSRRQRAMLTRLLMDPGHVVTADQLIESAWGDAPPLEPLAALQNQISRLRTYLGPLRESLITRAPGYVFDLPIDCLDSYHFERLTQEARQIADNGDARLALDYLNEALSLWQGSAFAEFADNIARSRAVLLEQERLAAIEDRIDLLLKLGEAAIAIGQAESINAVEPLRERPYAQRMKGLALEGRMNESLAVFQELRDRLSSELGVEPSEELKNLHVRILRQEIEPSIRAKAQKSTSAAVAGLSEPPNAASSFIGRAGEIDRLRTYVGKHVVTSIVGPGGVGKTRLAMETAKILSALDPVCWIELAELEDEKLVASAILSSLGIINPPPEPANQALLTVLKQRTLILILDNCEHLMEGVADVVQRIVQSCPAVRVVTTSREPLRISGEQVLPLEPLPSGAESVAVTLFIDRLREAGYLFSDDSAADVALSVRICEKLDGLPLALEIAAATAVELGLPMVAADTANLKMNGGRRSVASRHQDLRQLLSWSYNILSAEEKTLLRRLAVFPGKFSFAQARQVCGGAPLATERIQSLLANLVRKSLVSRLAASPSSDRAFALLFTVREFALNHLRNSTENDDLNRKASWYTIEWASRLGANVGRGAGSEMSQLAEGLSDLRASYLWADLNDPSAAVQIAASTALFASHRLEYEVLNWAEREVQNGRVASIPGDVYFAASNFAIRKGSLALAEKYAREGIESARSESDSVAARTALAHCFLIQGKPREAMRVSEENWMAAVRIGDDLSAMANAGTVAIAASYIGEFEVADAWISKCQDISKRVGSPMLRAYSSYFTGEVVMHSSPERALRVLGDAYDIASNIGDRFIAGIALTSLVTLRARVAKSRESFEAYGFAMNSLLKGGDTTALWLAVRNMIPILWEMNLDIEAYTLYVAMNNSLSAPPVYGQERMNLEAAAQGAAKRIGASSVRQIAEQWKYAEDQEAFRFAIDLTRSIAKHIESDTNLDSPDR
ncbi:BTAD domain-containing putative transcriptional regulator [Streptomyces sp. 3211]|uniref:BTAD domain-containing putative transcriptional regulator n=1 Tax=Streptomyces sp. 3211 TaxID=1964449 RepID=UPI001331B252|nr:BTAD domain-containing putative transcriptional regulator [Streptomyces sp. 3211]